MISTSAVRRCIFWTRFFVGSAAASRAPRLGSGKLIATLPGAKILTRQTAQEEKAIPLETHRWPVKDPAAELVEAASLKNRSREVVDPLQYDARAMRSCAGWKIEREPQSRVEPPQDDPLENMRNDIFRRAKTRGDKR